MRALLTGITGQDGSYLAELLLAKGYEVHGLVRRVAGADLPERHWRLASVKDQLVLHAGMIDDYASVLAVVDTVQPDECYHLAAQSDVRLSFDDPFGTLSTNMQGTHYVLEALRQRMSRCRFYFAGSSEQFGSAPAPQNEATPFRPRSPYAISKVAGFQLTRFYREAYGMHCSSGILFNHESPRRGLNFVTRKIAAGVVRLHEQVLCLGNLDACRDWGHARDYVDAMWRMLQQDVPDDYVIATGRTHSVREFVVAAFAAVGITDWEPWVRLDPAMIRPAEVDRLQGDATKAQKVLGWSPTASFDDLVREMVHAEIERLGVTR